MRRKYAFSRPKANRSALYRVVRLRVVQGDIAAALRVVLAGDRAAVRTVGFVKSGVVVGVSGDARVR